MKEKKQQKIDAFSDNFNLVGNCKFSLFVQEYS